MILHDVKQGSSEWLMLRAGIPTASEFGNLVTPAFEVRSGETPKTYLARKVAEKILGYPEQTGSGGGGSFAMQQGSLLEIEAIPWLEFQYGVKVQRVGFCTTDDGRIGCSPDGLIGTDGGIECKCPEPHTHVRTLLAGVPKEHLAQVHGNMLVTGRPWWYFLSYCRNFPPLLVKIERDPAIEAALREALDVFLKAFDSSLATVRALINATAPKQGGERS